MTTDRQLVEAARSLVVRTWDRLEAIKLASGERLLDEDELTHAGLARALPVEVLSADPDEVLLGALETLGDMAIAARVRAVRGSNAPLSTPEGE